METAALIGELRLRQETIATCESLTAGLIGAELTSVPGASVVVRGGLITYATDLKVCLAGVSADLVRCHGVVSAEVATAMAEGACQACRSTWGVAVTGVAGPDEVDGLPAGTVWTAVVGPGVVEARVSRYPGDRGQVRQATVAGALDLLAEILAGAPAAR
ncbi:MAG: CinA family protein [Actinomycetia bacterium]|nr:CinA family protein [Actinomycetes bacterium]